MLLVVTSEALKVELLSNAPVQPLEERVWVNEPELYVLLVYQREVFSVEQLGVAVAGFARHGFFETELVLFFRQDASVASVAIEGCFLLHGADKLHGLKGLFFHKVVF